jgi:hypothetical protein
MMFRLIPTRRSGQGDWFRPWTVDGEDADAIVSAKEFFGVEGVPVLIRRLGVSGPESTLGIWGERRLRPERVRR